DPAHPGELRKLLPVGMPPFTSGIEEAVLDRGADEAAPSSTPSGETDGSRPRPDPDGRAFPDFWRSLWAADVNHALIEPVTVFDRPVAALCFGNAATPFSESNIEAARRLAAATQQDIARLALHQKMILSETTARRAYQQLIEFSRVGNLIVQEKDLDRICNLFMQVLREHSVFRRGILTLLDDDMKGYKWFFFGMSDEEIEYFHSHAANKMSREQRAKIFQEKYRVSNSYYIPAASHWEYTGVRSRCSEERMLDWHPDDFLFIPLFGSHKRMVGIVSVDDPSDGRVPSEEGLSSLELFANQVAHAIEEKKLDQEVKKSTRRYRTLVETMNDGLVVMDFAERITMVNPTLSRLVGYRLEEMIGSSLFTFLSKSSRAAVMAKRDERRLGIKSRYEVELVSKEGTTIPVIMSGAPLYESNRLVGSFAVISDLREQKKSEAEFRVMHQEIVDANVKLQDSMEKLQRTQEQLVQAEKLSAVGELVSGVAHELNNPLTGVLGYAQLLLGRDVSPKVKKQLSTIYKEATRCQKIVQNLLTFARKHRPEKSYVDINEIILATVELRSYQMRVDNVDLLTDLEKNLPKTMADYHQFQQVFINIINNAHHAMVEGNGRGSLLIRSRVREGRIVVSFEDDGPGIPEEALGKIFDPFFTTKDVGKGTGLGLSLSYGIVQEHGGSIRAGNRDDGRPGAVFDVELPIWSEPQPDRGEGTIRPARIATGKRILVVDDEETVLELLSDLLSSRGHEVHTAADGGRALDLLRDDSAAFDVIICDMKMPVLGGEELHATVFDMDPALAGRMIFATGDTVSEAATAFLDRTGCPYVSKPFHLEEIERLIGVIVGSDEEAGCETSTSTTGPPGGARPV
ncbi:MAG: ATP-binding protein, partial [Acidobacteriota bacterium]